LIVMEGSFLFDVIPPALRAALAAEGMASVDLVSEVLHHAFDTEGLLQPEAMDMQDLALTISNTLIAALNPLAQRLMATMQPYERAEVMAWLSNPTPIASAMIELMDTLLSESDQARAFAESAIQIASSVPEVAEMLELEGGFLPPPAEVLAELRHLRDGGSSATFRQPPEERERERQRQHQLADAVAADALATATNALVADAPSRAQPPQRRSARLGLRRRSCPLLVLDDDCTNLVLQILSPDAHAALECASREWRAAVRRLHQSPKWQASFGCVYASSTLRVLSESAKARLDVGPEGTHPRPLGQLASLRLRQLADCGGIWGEGVGSDKWTQLVVRRLDGPSIGYLSTRHTIGLFTSDGTHRLDLVYALNPQPVSHESGGTRVRLCPYESSSEIGARLAPSSSEIGAGLAPSSSEIGAGLAPAAPTSEATAAAALSPSAAVASSSTSAAAPPAAQALPLRYGQVLSLLSACGTYRLSLGMSQCHVLVSAAEDVWSTRLLLSHVDLPVERERRSGDSSRSGDLAGRAARATARAMQAQAI
jgi:hypothetical protein